MNLFILKVIGAGKYVSDLVSWYIVYKLILNEYVKYNEFMLDTILWILWMILARRLHYCRYPLWIEIGHIFQALLAIISISLLIKCHDNWSLFSVGFILGNLALFVIMPINRVLVVFLLRKVSMWQLPTLIFGTDENAVEAKQAIDKDAYLGYECVGFVNFNSLESLDEVRLKKPSLKNYSLFQHKWDNSCFNFYKNYECIIPFESGKFSLIKKIIEELITHNIRGIHLVSSKLKIPLVGFYQTHILQNRLMLLSINSNINDVAHKFIKRLFDLTLALFIIPFTIPVFIFIFILMKFDPGPMIYSQMRVGLHGKLFKCYKIRTMRPEADKLLEHILVNDSKVNEEWSKNRKIKEDPRLSKIGKFLRNSSLDELPQIWNVIKGDMSLVGPRPIVAEEIEKYKQNFAFYKLTRPGITGLWQVSGRSDVDYVERVNLDVWYVQNWNIWLDVVIITKTIPAILSRKGAY